MLRYASPLANWVRLKTVEQITQQATLIIITVFWKLMIKNKQASRVCMIQCGITAPAKHKNDIKTFTSGGRVVVLFMSPVTFEVR